MRKFIDVVRINLLLKVVSKLGHVKDSSDLNILSQRQFSAIIFMYFFRWPCHNILVFLLFRFSFLREFKVYYLSENGQRNSTQQLSFASSQPFRIFTVSMMCHDINNANKWRSPLILFFIFDKCTLCVQDSQVHSQMK